MKTPKSPLHGDTSAPASSRRPSLTLPVAEAKALRNAYDGAHRILEYGSGGSTVMAADMPGKSVWSVESDRVWADNLRAYLEETPRATGTDVVVHHADIGPTKEWGYPVDESHWQKFPGYSLGIWDLAGFEPPDVVLVDGRFRVGCALATAFRTKAPIDLYFDDYIRRSAYRVVEQFFGQPVMIGRMAKFRVEPTPLPNDDLLRIIDLLCRIR